MRAFVAARFDRLPFLASLDSFVFLHYIAGYLFFNHLFDLYTNRYTLNVIPTMDAYSHAAICLIINFLGIYT